MNGIKFEKVSFEQFELDCKKLGFVDKEIKEAYDKIELPKRATNGSAGYDFKVLLLMPRSSLGFKSGMRLVNTLGVIDSDYYYSNNEGHIMMKFEYGFKELYVEAFDRVMQGIFTTYYTTEDDDANATRNGGFGSTGN